jgi:hypothetical protein
LRGGEFDLVVEKEVACCGTGPGGGWVEGIDGGEGALLDGALTDKEEFLLE